MSKLFGTDDCIILSVVSTAVIRIPGHAIKTVEMNGQQREVTNGHTPDIKERIATTRRALAARKPTPPPDLSDFLCGCGRGFASRKGLAVHQGRVHHADSVDSNGNTAHDTGSVTTEPSECKGSSATLPRAPGWEERAKAAALAGLDPELSMPTGPRQPQ